MQLTDTPRILISGFRDPPHSPSQMARTSYSGRMIHLSHPVTEMTIANVASYYGVIRQEGESDQDLKDRLTEVIQGPDKSQEQTWQDLDKFFSKKEED